MTFVTFFVSSFLSFSQTRTQTIYPLTDLQVSFFTLPRLHCTDMDEWFDSNKLNE